MLCVGINGTLCSCTVSGNTTSYVIGCCYGFYFADITRCFSWLTLAKLLPCTKSFIHPISWQWLVVWSEKIHCRWVSACVSGTKGDTNSSQSWLPCCIAIYFCVALRISIFIDICFAFCESLLLKGIPTGARDFSGHQSVCTGSAAHPASYLVGTDFFPRQ